MTNLKTCLKTIKLILAAVAICIAGAVGATERVNVNTADAETLASALSGVGLKKAQAIVRYREEHGRFDTPSDLAKVKGIGAATVDKNADRIVVSSAEQPAADD